MNQLVLGFGNKARHGKDTAVSAIRTYCEEQHIPVKVVPFAEALRREVTDAITKAGSVEELLKREIFSYEPVGSDAPLRCFSTRIPDWVKPSPNPDLSDPLLPHGKHSLLLQWWGTEFRRAQDRDYWVKEWRRQVAQFSGVVIAQDVRFLNEADAIKSMGGVTAVVMRRNADGTPFRDPGRDPNHKSETALDDYNWDYHLIAHTGEVAWLEYQALNLFDYVYVRAVKDPANVIRGWKSYPDHCTFTLPKAA